MQRQVNLVRPGETPSARFRQFTVKTEGIQVLSPTAVENLVHTFHRTPARSILSRYFAAKQKLQDEFGATVELVKNAQGAVKIFARMEMLTDHKHMDDDTYNLVVGMGFDLTLHHTFVPVEECFYLVKTGRYQEGLELSSLADVAESLLRLGDMLRTEFSKRAIELEAKSASSDTAPQLKLVQPIAALQT